MLRNAKELTAGLLVQCYRISLWSRWDSYSCSNLKGYHIDLPIRGHAGLALMTADMLVLRHLVVLL